MINLDCCPNQGEGDLDPLEIYLSPIEINIDPVKDKNKFFITKHSLIFSQQGIRYTFTDPCNDVNTRQWTVLNSSFITKNNGIKYKLDSFHVHNEGEHIINGVEYDMEMHFVFLDDISDFDDSKLRNIFVYAILFELGDSSSRLITDILNKREITFPNSYTCHCSRIIDEHFVTYNGSLTKPLGETIFEVAANWNISMDIETIDREDLDFFRCVYARESSNTKPLNGRNINVIGCECCY